MKDSKRSGKSKTGNDQKDNCVERSSADGRQAARVRPRSTRTLDGQQPSPVQPSPLMVIRGANKVTSTVHVGIDWFRASSSNAYGDVVDDLTKLFGPSQAVKGRHRYQAGFRFASGAEVMYDLQDGLHGERHRVDIPGSALCALGMDKASALCSSLCVGHIPTRIDLCMDFKAGDGETVGLIDALISSAEAGQLCLAHRWEPRRTISCGRLTKYGINFGARGAKNGSGRYVRVYDKGLETGEAPAGKWERFEVEFTGEPAWHVADLFRSDDWSRTAANFITGAIDFREVVPGETALARRPRVDWWATLLDGLKPVKAAAMRVKTNFDRYANWMQHSVLPTLKALSTDDRDVVQVLDDLGFSHSLPPADAESRPVIWQYRKEYCPNVPKGIDRV